MARILLAEDDDSLRTFLARALGRAGHEVHAVGDGDTALAALDDDEFDLLLADIVMPGADGIEVARRAGAGFPGLRLMLITGRSEEHTSELQSLMRISYAGVCLKTKNKK